MIAAAEVDPATPHDSTTSRLVHDWINDDLRTWAYARRQGDLWAVAIPGFSIATQAATREAAFAQATTLLADYFVACLGANITLYQSARPLPRRSRLAHALQSLFAESASSVLQRPPRVHRHLLTTRSFNLPRVPSAKERLDAMKSEDTETRLVRLAA